MAAIPARQLLIQNIESFVDSSLSSSQQQQKTNVDFIANLLKNDVITIEQLAREMELYLTTADHVLRARGILLLAEVLACLDSKRLPNMAIHTLVGFFTARLIDWRALHGALVGCSALLRRKSNAGVVSMSDARDLAKSYLENLHVQSLGHRDRKLCFELLGILLDRYVEAVTELDDLLVSGICEAIDEEKDPECLIHTFHIVEVLGRRFPDPAGPVAKHAQDLFDIIGCYFPIHYVHPNNEDVQVCRDNLSKALMLAFSSSTHFEPFSIPLLLEKLSSSLPLAKVDSLKYLTYCTTNYGPERMAKHTDALWGAIKIAVYQSVEDDTSILSLSWSDNQAFPENEVIKEVLILLQKLSSQSIIFVDVVLHDEDIRGLANLVSSTGSFDDLPLKNKQKLIAVGRILAVLAKSSHASCNRVFEAVFVRLMDTIAVSLNSSSVDAFVAEADTSFKSLNFGVVYLCIQILGACRELAHKSLELSPDHDFSNDEWYQRLTKVSISLANTFRYNLLTSIRGNHPDEYISLTVKALQFLATFPRDSSLITQSLYEHILTTLCSIICTNFKLVALWKSALKALVEIGSFIEEHNEFEKSLCFIDIVVERTISLLSTSDSAIPFSLLLEAISEISTAGNTFTLRIVQRIEDTMKRLLYEVYVDGDTRHVSMLVQLLECYSFKLLPRVQKNKDFGKTPFHFADSVWDLMGKAKADVTGNISKELLYATMRALKLAVASCSEEDQCLIVDKAFGVISSSETILQMRSMSAQFKRMQLANYINSFASRDDWLLSLYASVIMAVRCGTCIPNTRDVAQTFMTAILEGHMPSAQALGSIVNKMQPRGKGSNNLDSFYLEDVLEIIFNMIPWRIEDNILLRAYEMDDNGMVELTVEDNACLHVNSIIGLSWIGKGLLMRGHEKIKDIVMIFLRCLIYGKESEDIPCQKGTLERQSLDDALPPLMKSAADAFHVLISDSEDCLTKRFHATVRPLYKQRLFSIITPVLLPLMNEARSPSFKRSVLARAFGHVISGTPLAVVLSDAGKLLPTLLDALSTLSEDITNRDMIYGLLLVLSGILMDKSGRDTVTENVHIVVKCLCSLISYPHKMLVRETAVQCLIAVCGLSHTRIFPLRIQVLRAVAKALDDPRRAVRQEAVRCHHAWSSIA